MQIFLVTLFHGKQRSNQPFSRSSTEAEYRNLWFLANFHGFIKHDLFIVFPILAIVFCENEVAIMIAYNRTFHEHTKQIEINCHFIKLQHHACLVSYDINHKMKNKSYFL